ncbi:MAG: type II secretion system F family protein [Nitrospirales bacterium]|nr:type II secretion system F family protein [Nitrospirales bacterium]
MIPVIIISFIVASIATFITLAAVSKKRPGEEFIAEGEAIPSESGISITEMKKRFLVGHLDIGSETLYFLLLFLLFLQSGLPIRPAIGRAYYSLSSMGFQITKYLKDIISRIDSGVPFTQAVKVLDKYPEVSILRESFSNILQAQELGAPIEDSIKTTLKELEESRVLKAEERASKMSVLLAIPVVFGFLPAIIILVAYPAMYQLLKALGGMTR